jgi:Xaa-Pro aminopeptidase
LPHDEIAASTPRMDPEILRRRRERFHAQIADGVCVLAGPGEALRAGDVHYKFRQDSDLLYLTGFEEPDTVAVFAPNHPNTRFVLFVRPRDPSAETWTGRRAGIEGAMERFGADAAYPLADLGQMLPRFIEGNETLYYALGREPAFDKRVTDVLNDLRARARAGVAAPSRIVDPRSILHEMRLFKGPEEIAILRRAAEITREAHLAGLAAIRPGAYEYEVEAAIEYTFRRRGADGPAYPTIVGSGPNAAILHYIRNDREIRPGELVLVDAGAEVDHYNADVTRTYPVGGPYPSPARDVVHAVLAAQRAGIDAVRPGLRLNEVHQTALRSLVGSLIELGFLSGELEELVAKEAYRPFYMHRTSHWLGMDVHDVGRYRVGEESRKLEPGMVLTVEPGIYVPPDADAPERLRGIGVRIEDDVLVTDAGREVLTESIPKEIERIEALVPHV